MSTPIKREIYYSDEYKAYYESLDAKTQAKFDYVEQIIRTQYIVNSKFIKKLEESDFYEARVSVGYNEYRTIVFAIDSLSFMESKRVLFLNSFMKKSSKQYNSEMNLAQRILNRYVQED